MIADRERDQLVEQVLQKIVAADVRELMRDDCVKFGFTQAGKHGRWQQDESAPEAQGDGSKDAGGRGYRDSVDLEAAGTLPPTGCGLTGGAG